MVLSNELHLLIDEIKQSTLAGVNCTSIFTRLRNNSTLNSEIFNITEFLDLIYSDIKVGQRIYHINESIYNVLLCPVCNSPRVYHRLNKGYFATCGSIQCKKKTKISGFKKTITERYGGDYFKEGSESREKYKSTMLEKYGVNHNFSDGILRKSYDRIMEKKYGSKYPLKNTDILKKRNDTCIKNHGTLSFITSDKTKSTNLTKYGYENAILNSDISKKSGMTFSENRRNEMRHKLNSVGIDLLNYSSVLCELKCNKCEYIFNNHPVTINSKLRLCIDICLKCNPNIFNRSKLEIELYNFIESIYDGKIETSYRKIFINDPAFSEVDIYLPDLKIAFEFNGLYWHSEIYKDKNYHKKKTEAALANGVRLYHIWEDDWNYKNDIIKSRIRSSMNISNRIFARSCKLKNVNQLDYKNFCNVNHLKGYCPASHIIGLYHNDNLVSLMGFSKTRKLISSKNTAYEYELIRSCSALDVSVLGGISKIISEFKKSIGGSLVTYCDAAFSPDPNNTGYHKCGFRFIGSTSPGYYWVIDDKKSNRLNWTKSKLTDLGHDPGLTVDYIMHENGYYKIWDCGNHKFELIV
jgi:hypothetical protein